MNKTIAALLLSGMVLMSCEPKQASRKFPTTDYASEAKKLDLLLSQGDIPPQRFKVSATGTSEITGAKGIFLRIDPNDLETESGKPLGDNILIEIREFTQPHEFVFSDVTSKSFNGQQVLFGGSYWISMTSGGNKVKLRPGRALKVDFKRFSTKRMELFTASRDSIQNLIWVPANQRFKRISWEGSLEAEEYYMSMPITRLGWIASAVSNRASHNTSATLAFDLSDPREYSFGKAFLIAENNGTVHVLNSPLFFDGKDEMIFEQVPLEGSGLLVVTAIKNGKLYGFAKRLQLENAEMQMVKLEPMAPAELYETVLKLK